MITGVDYIFYSNTNPFNIEDKFISLLKNIWEMPIIEEFERSLSRLELFFSKNNEMNQWFDDNGYSLDKNDQGCFMLISNKMDYFESEIDIINIVIPKERENTDKYNSCLLLKDVWEYSLVLPDEIINNKFSLSIYNDLLAVLR